MSSHHAAARAPVNAHDPQVDEVPPEREAPAAYRADPGGLPPHLAFGGEVILEVATHLCVQGHGYAHEGRGPWAFDDVGMVRACVQAAADWEEFQRSRGWAPPLGDFTGYAPGKIDVNHLGAMLEDWGLVHTRGPTGNISKDAQPGDVILYLGRGPLLGVCIAPWRETGKFPNFESPAVAYVWADQPPRVSRDSRMGWMPLVLYRWQGRRQ